MSRKTSFENPYVSRGGIKLEKAFLDFNISAENKKAADVGSSTGGFTDYLLKNGALSVIAIDGRVWNNRMEIKAGPKGSAF